MPIALVGAAVAAAGSVAAGSMKANAARKAGNKQVSALEAQLQSLESDLNTDSMNQRALEADDRNIQQRLDLQAKYDPALRDLRTAGSDKLLGIVNNLGNNASDRVAAQLEKEALPQDMGLEDLRKRFIVTANEELDAGGMLTPDVQAEIARAGLEVGGSVTGSQGSGFNKNISRQLLGERSLALRAERQQRAVGLANTASQLQAQRISLLAQIMPQLRANTESNAQIASGGLQISDALLPAAGLSGADVTNIWMAKVGAKNQLTQQKADVQAKSTLAQGTAWGEAIGGATSSLGGASGLGGMTGSLFKPSTWAMKT